MTNIPSKKLTHRTTLMLSPTQAVQLKRIKERTGISEAQVIREGIDIGIKIYFDKLEALHQIKHGEKETIRKAAHGIEKLLDNTFGEST